MQIIPNYQITEQLYESINSSVYRGLRKKDNQPVILKMLKQDYPTQAELDRYQQEYEIIQELDLDGVIIAYNIEKYKNTPVIVLEDFGGESLKKMMLDRSFIVKEFLPIAIQITDILGNIHENNIIHKDINPSNIIWESISKQLKIIDFGIASRLPRENPTLKNPEQLEGTLPYLSPEQTGRINRSMDYRTDLYSLGITFYEILTGKLPFDSTDAMELVHCHIAKIPIPVNEINPKIPQIISDIVMKLLAKNAEDRYQSAFGIKADFEKILNLTGFEDLEGLSFELAQHDFSGKFEIPQKLYGRENEINTLLQAFARVTNGNTEIMLVAGYSGVGKTALVHEVHKPMTEKRGYFAGGKFDQFQKNIPYSAITQAFNQFCRYLLMENTESLANWKTKILTAVGNNGQIIIDVIPDLELVIGKQPAVAEIGATESQNRFQIFFLNFVKVLCSKKYPFILFIDDLQWVDSASLILLKTIMLDTEIQHLLIIGAYRDNEVDSSHPFITAVDELKKTSTIINSIELTNLQLSDVNELLQDTLHSKTSKTLADLVYQKTQGNAFFTQQFLHTLYEEELLRFEQQQWQWDVAQIADKNITDNVVELMANKIDKLPEQTSKVLQLAACIGNRFKLSILAIISKSNQADIQKGLQLAIFEGLIQPLAEKDHFKFLHDRIQQAAYTRINNEQKQIVHLQIGRLLLTIKTDQIIFDIVNHLNFGAILIESSKETIELAKLNLEAGQKAMLSYAYGSAYRYLKQGITYLPENCWQTHYRLVLDLKIELAEAACLNIQFDDMKVIIDETLSNINYIMDKIKLYQLLISYYHTHSEFRKAVEISLNVLEQLGETFPQQPNTQDFLDALDDVNQLITKTGYDNLSMLPKLQDQQKLAALSILHKSLYPAYFAVPEILGLIICRVVKLTIQYGKSSFTPFAFAAFSVLLNGGLSDIATGSKFGKLAIAIFRRDNDISTKAIVYNLYFGLSQHFFKPIKQCIDPLLDGYLSFAENGDAESCAYCFINSYMCAFFGGYPLPEIKHKFEPYISSAVSLKQEQVIHQLHIWNQVIVNLQNNSDFSDQLKGQFFDIDVMLPVLFEAKNFNTCNYANVAQLLLYYTFGYYESAYVIAIKTEPNLAASTGKAFIPSYNFYYSLTLTSIYSSALPELQKQYLEKLETNQQQMKIWADNCPENFLHKYLLVQAEMARIEGKDLEAMGLYDQAIASAKENEFIQNEALANELTAKFWETKNKPEFAQIYLKKARYAYQQWGALAKVRDLEAKYSQLLITPKHLNANTNNTVMSSNATQLQMSTVLDLDSITKASQTLTGEIVLSKLLEKMMYIVIENAGAERGFLLLPKDEIWFIEAEGAIDKQEVTILNSLPIDKYLPEAIISYVGRTKEDVRLDNASQEGLYT